MGGHREPKPGEIRFPFQPLAAALGLTEAAAARYLGLSGSTEVHYRQWGMSEKVADRMAVKAGLVPGTVWPEMLERAVSEVMAVCASPRCPVEFLPKRAGHVFCSERCRRLEQRKRQYRARYQSDPEFAASERARRRAYRAAYREYENRQARAYYAANAEAKRQERRERYRRQQQEAA